MNLKTKVFFALIASLTLGLAPFSPEPHLLGKLKWIAGGGDGMGLMDFWDTFMHGAPWIVLIYFVVRLVLQQFKKPTDLKK